MERMQDVTEIPLTLEPWKRTHSMWDEVRFAIWRLSLAPLISSIGHSMRPLARKNGSFCLGVDELQYTKTASKNMEITGLRAYHNL